MWLFTYYNGYIRKLLIGYFYLMCYIRELINPETECMRICRFSNREVKLYFGIKYLVTHLSVLLFNGVLAWYFRILLSYNMTVYNRLKQKIKQACHWITCSKINTLGYKDISYVKSISVLQSFHIEFITRLRQLDMWLTMSRRGLFWLSIHTVSILIDINSISSLLSARFIFKPKHIWQNGQTQAIVEDRYRLRNWTSVYKNITQGFWYMYVCFGSASY